MNKSGKIEQSVLISIILAIVIGVIVLTAVVFPVSGAAGGGLSDELCHFNMALRNSLPSGSKFLINPILCSEVNVGNINANSYDTCPTIYKDNAELCGAYQIAKLADRCLYRGGGRNPELGLQNEFFICFKNIKLRNLENNKISEETILNVIGENTFKHGLKKTDINLFQQDQDKVITAGEAIGITFDNTGSNENVCIGATPCKELF